MAMNAEEAPVEGGVRWKRFTLAAVPAFLAAGVLGALTMEGAVAASFAVSGDNFKVSADKLDGTGFAQYGDVSTSLDDTDHPVAISVIDEAELTNLCQSVLMDTPVGEVTLLVNAGGEGTPASAENLVVDVEQLRGDAVFSNMEIGRDASTLDKASPTDGAAGAFGQQADSVVIDDLQQVAWSVNAGTFKLSGLHLDVKPGNHECF